MKSGILKKIHLPENPLCYLRLSFLLGIMTSCIYLFCSVNIYRDTAFCYAFAVQEAAKYGNWSFCLDPGLPVLNMVLSVPVAMAGMEAFQALFCVGAIFWICTLFPLYVFLKRFVPPLTASCGCLMYILTPKLMRFSCSGLLESSRNFFFLSALLLLFQLSDRKTAGRIVLFALSLAGLSLARAEGCVISGFLLLALLITELRIRRKIINSLLYTFSVGILVLLLILPKLIYNFQKTGYPTLDTRFNPYLNAVFHLDKFLVPPPDFPPVLDLAHSSAAHSGGEFHWLGNLNSVFSGLTRGAYELYFVLGVIGVILIIFRWKRIWEELNIPVPRIVSEGWRWEYTVMTGMTLLHCAIYFADCSAYRYYTFMIPIVILWALVPLELLWQTAQKLPGKWHVPECLLVIALIISILHYGNGISFAFQGKEDWKIGKYLQSVQTEFLKPGKKRVRVFNMATEICYFSGFQYANTSLNSKSRALLTKEGEFDLLVCPDPCDELPKLVKKYHLIEWKKHPYAGKIQIWVPASESGRK